MGAWASSSPVVPTCGWERVNDRHVSAVAEELKKVELFAGLNQRQLRQLARLMEEPSFGPGVRVVDQGTMSGVCFFIIAEGEAPRKWVPTMSRTPAWEDEA